MNTNQLQILLADDDEDDCLFFKEALDELPIATHLTTVWDGEQLMQLLTKSLEPLPHVLFLDLNMPRKSGYECLLELKRDQKLSPLPVIILSTSFEPAMVDLLYKNGAKACLCKPAGRSALKQVIQQALTLVAQANGSQGAKQDFSLNGALS